jgi:hypothetical protein
MSPPPLACPDCPMCGDPPFMILAGAVQAFCGNEACEAWTWNPSVTRAENLKSVGRVTFSDWMDEIGEPVFRVRYYTGEVADEPGFLVSVPEERRRLEAQRVKAVTDERDRLRLIVERAHDRVGADEHVLRTLDVDGLIELVGVLRRDYAEAKAETTIQTRAADAAAEAVGNMAEYASRAIAERDRLRDTLVMLAEPPTGFDCPACRLSADLALAAIGGKPAVAGRAREAPTEVDAQQLDGSSTAPGVRCDADMPEAVGAIMAERDRLQAVVDGLRGYLALQDVGEEPSEVTGVFDDLRAIVADVSPEATDE